MPSVSGPSDGGYNNYQRSISELEEELQNEAKRNREATEELASRLERNYEKLARKTEEKQERAVASIRETAEEHAAAVKRSHHSDLEQAKARTYDRYGRFRGEEADVLKQQVDSLKKGLESASTESKHDLDEAARINDSRSEATAIRHQDELNRAIEATKETYRETYEDDSAQQKAEFGKYKDDQARGNARAEQERQDLTNFQRKELERTLSEMKRSYEHQIDQAERSQRAQSRSHKEALSRAMKDQTEKIREVHQEENTRLRGDLGKVLYTQNQWLAEHGDARANAVRELESDWTQRQNAVQKSYEGIIEDLKKSAKNTEKVLNQRQDQAVQDRNDHFTEVIRDQHTENRGALRDLAASEDRARQQLQMQNRREKELHERAVEHQAGESAKARDAALSNQSLLFQEALKRQKDSDAVQLKRLETYVHDLNTSDNPSVIPPAAENLIRKSVIREYEKSFDVEKERNRKALDSTLESNSSKLQEVLQEKGTRETTLNREHSFAQQSQKRELLDHIGELELNRKIEKRNTDVDQNREIENIRRSAENMLNRQRREYEDILEKSRIDGQNKMSAFRQDSEFAMKMTHREFNARETATIREYERKMDNQKLELMDLVQSAKEMALKTARESERQTRQALEEATRSYEQRIIQLEAQHKERERFLSQNFEDQMEKVKRSHALLLQKKG